MDYSGYSIHSFADRFALRCLTPLTINGQENKRAKEFYPSYYGAEMLPIEALAGFPNKWQRSVPGGAGKQGIASFIAGVPLGQALELDFDGLIKLEPGRFASAVSMNGINPLTRTEEFKVKMYGDVCPNHKAPLASPLTRICAECGTYRPGFNFYPLYDDESAIVRGLQVDRSRTFQFVTTTNPGESIASRIRPAKEVAPAIGIRLYSRRGERWERNQHSVRIGAHRGLLEKMSGRDPGKRVCIDTDPLIAGRVIENQKAIEPVYIGRLQTGYPYCFTDYPGVYSEDPNDYAYLGDIFVYLTTLNSFRWLKEQAEQRQLELDGIPSVGTNSPAVEETTEAESWFERGRYKRYEGLKFNTFFNDPHLSEDLTVTFALKATKVCNKVGNFGDEAVVLLGVLPKEKHVVYVGHVRVPEIGFTCAHSVLRVPLENHYGKPWETVPGVKAICNEWGCTAEDLARQFFSHMGHLTVNLSGW